MSKNGAVTELFQAMTVPQSKGERSMHPLIRSPITIACFALLGFASGMRNVAFGHEGHQMECTKTSMQAVKADIQAMNNGEAKTMAMKEIKMAEEMMDKKDMNACKTHMHNAMDATDK